MRTINIPFSTIAVISGALLAATYVFYGGSISNKRSKKKSRNKGVPGLVNLGNSCFLNCILQALSSCHSFCRWLKTEEFSLSSPILISSLVEIVTELCGTNEDHSINAQSVMDALRSHGWVISAEEQDAHEFFHALTSTLDDEIELLNKQTSSLLDVSWFKSHTSTDSMIKSLINSDSRNFSGSHLSASSCPALYPDTMEISSVERSSLHSLYFDAEENLEISSSSSSFNTDRIFTSKLSCIQKSHLPVFKVTNLESPFKGYLASQLQCCVCGYKNTLQWNEFNSISLSLPSTPSPISSSILLKTSLQSLLSSFVSREFVTDVTCKGCSVIKGENIRTMFGKQLTFGKLPDCLCIHVQRKVYLENGMIVKRKDFVSVPEVLNMSPYSYSSTIKPQRSELITTRMESFENCQPKSKIDECSNTSRESTSIASKCAAYTSNNNENQCKVPPKKHSFYKLQAIVVHVGDAFSGHFVTYRKGPVTSSDFRDRWFYTSDVIVKEVTLQEVLSATAYMVIYERLSF